MIEIQKCSYNDIDAILEIEKKSFRYPYGRATFWHYLTAHNAGFLVAKHEQKIVGYVIFSYDRSKGTIVSIAVDNAYRRKGIGSILLQTALQHLPEKVSTVELQVSVNNDEAIAFYLVHGFKRAGTIEKYYSDNSDAAVMAMQLNRNIKQWQT